MWNDVLKAALSLLAAVVAASTPVLVAWVHRRFNAQQVGMLNGFAATAVHAVEQISKTANWSNQQRYTVADQFLTQLAEKAGITLKEEDLRPLIEGALHVMDNTKVGELIPAQVGTIEAAPLMSATGGLSLEEMIGKKVEEALGNVTWSPMRAVPTPQSPLA